MYFVIQFSCHVLLKSIVQKGFGGFLLTSFSGWALVFRCCSRLLWHRWWFRFQAPLPPGTWSHRDMCFLCLGSPPLAVAGSELGLGPSSVCWWSSWGPSGPRWGMLCCQGFYWLLRPWLWFRRHQLQLDARCRAMNCPCCLAVCHFCSGWRLSFRLCGLLLHLPFCSKYWFTLLFDPRFHLRSLCYWVVQRFHRNQSWWSRSCLGLWKWWYQVRKQSHWGCHRTLGALLLCLRRSWIRSVGQEILAVVLGRTDPSRLDALQPWQKFKFDRSCLQLPGYGFFRVHRQACDLEIAHRFGFQRQYS